MSFYQSAANFMNSLMANTVHSDPPTPAEKGHDSEHQAEPTWTSEALLALEEETSNHGAHIMDLILLTSELYNTALTGLWRILRKNLMQSQCFWSVP
jgi:hypothetical protein